jgi:hypothetical protein
VGLDDSHTEGPEETINVTNLITATGGQLFEVYAIHSEGPLFNAIVSAKTLPTERLFTSEKEAQKRAQELQANERVTIFSAPSDRSGE